MDFFQTYFIGFKHLTPSFSASESIHLSRSNQYISVCVCVCSHGYLCIGSSVHLCVACGMCLCRPESIFDGCHPLGAAELVF